MPSEELWEKFFTPAEALKALGLRRDSNNVVDLGCGYGTFTLPAATISEGTVHAFDIEPDMLDETRRKTGEAGLTNVITYLRDFIANGTELPDAFADYVMLFNLLHTAHPKRLLEECWRILAPSGVLAIIHWNYDPNTPRGPSMHIRPRPDECLKWTEQAGLSVLTEHIDLPPYHYGILAQRPAH